MKRFLTILLLLSLTLSLAACGNSAAPAEAKVPDAEVTEDVTEPEAEPWKCELSLTRAEFPRLDGSTSMVPLGKAAAAAILGEDEESVSDLVSFNRTTQSFINLMDGKCDLLLVGEPKASVFSDMEAAGFRYDIAPIATDALVFVVNENNPVDGLTTEQIRKIYTGEITNWKEVGGDDAPIVAFQRNDGAGSQALMLKLVMGDTEMAEAPSEFMAGSMGDLMSGVKNYDNSANAIGYSVYYYANDMEMAKGLKILSVDGVVPSAETIRSEAYPHRNSYYAVVAAPAEEKSSAAAMYNWLLSENGQQLIADCGYVSIMDLAAGKPSALVRDQYTRLSEDALPELCAGDYGMLIPYVGEKLYSTSYDGYSYVAGQLYGLADVNGQLVTDPVFTSVWAMQDHRRPGAPLWIMSRTEDVTSEDYNGYTFYSGTTRSAAAVPDGSRVTEREFASFYRSGDRIIATKDFETAEFTVFNERLEALFTEANLPDGFFNGQSTYVTYGDGLYNVYTTDKDGNSICRYLDETLTPVLGSYSYAMSFQDGLAVVQSGDSELYGVIDKNGRYVLEPVYEWISANDKGVITAMVDGRTDFYGTDGTLLISFPAWSASTADCGYEVFSDDYSATYYYDENGELLCECGSDGWQYTRLGSIFYRTEANGTTTLWDASSDRQVTLSNEVYVYPLTSTTEVEGSQSTRWLCASGYATDPYVYLIDRELNSIQEFAGAYASSWTDPMDGAEYILVIRPDDGTTELLSADGQSLGCWSGDVAVYGGYVRVTDDISCTIYSGTGEIVFRRMLDSALAD